jgi:hypothetical protein
VTEDEVLMWLRLGGEAELRHANGSPYLKGSPDMRWYIGDTDVNAIIMRIAYISTAVDWRSGYADDGSKRWTLRRKYT